MAAACVVASGAGSIACGPASTPVAPGAALGEADPYAAGEAGSLGIPQPLVEISLIVRDVAGLYLFAAEQAEAAAILAAWATSAGLHVAAPARTREILARAASGQDAITGKACGAPLWTLAAVERWREELRADGRIEATVACVPECILSVLVSEGLDIGARDAGRSALWTAPWDPAQPWRAELTRRLGELKPQALLPDVGARTAGARPRPAHTDAAFAAPTEEALPAASEAAAQACLGDVGAIGLLVETDARGAVARCEGYAQRIVANAPVAACACAALAGQPIGGGARRLATTVRLAPAALALTTRGGAIIDAHLAPRTKRDAGTGVVLPVVSDRSVREWEPPMPWTLAACFVDLPAGAPRLRADVTIHADAHGAVTAVDLAPVEGTLAPAQQACVAAAVRRATKVPCPDPGPHTLSAELVVQLRAP